MNNSYQTPPQQQMPPQQPQQQMPPQQPKKNSNKTLIAVLLAAVLLVCGGVAAFLLLNNKKSDSSAGETTAIADVEGKSDTPSALVADEERDELDKGETANIRQETDDIDEPMGKGGDENEIASANTDDDPEVAQVKKRLNNFQYSTYQNQRFGYQLNVPNFMAPGPESQNGDGRQFYFNGISLSVYASHNALDYDVAQQMDQMDNERQAVRRKIGNNAFMLSGKGDEGKLYEQKTVLKDEVWYTVRLDYPAKFKSVIAPLSQIVTGFEP